MTHYPDLDTRRDAVALLQAVARDDCAAVTAIVAGARCLGCLAVSVAVHGLALGSRHARDGFVPGEHGYAVPAGEYREWLDEQFASWLACYFAWEAEAGHG